MSDGIFTQPGPDGIFGRGGEPGDAAAPPIDGDGTPLRETLVAVFPSPGHMRVARAIRYPKRPPGQDVEFQEEYRVPTPEEVALLARQGIVAGPGSMVVSQGPAPVAGLGEVAPGSTDGQPWLKLVGALVVGAAGMWAVNKFVLPRFAGDDGGDSDEGEPEDDVADTAE